MPRLARQKTSTGSQTSRMVARTGGARSASSPLQESIAELAGGLPVGPRPTMVSTVGGMPPTHPLTEWITAAADGRFPEADGGWRRVPPWRPGLEAVIAFT